MVFWRTGEGVDLVNTDPIGDSSGGPDFVALAMADDDHNLFVKIEASSSFDLSENNNLRLYLDTDLNASTGKSIGGIGMNWNGVPVSVLAPSLGPATKPLCTTQTSRSWPTDGDQPCIRRSASADLLFQTVRTPLFAGSSVRLFVQDGADGDRIPNAGNAATYTFDVGGTPPIEKEPFLANRSTNSG